MAPQRKQTKKSPSAKKSSNTKHTCRKASLQAKRLSPSAAHNRPRESPRPTRSSRSRGDESTPQTRSPKNYQKQESPRVTRSFRSRGKESPQTPDHRRQNKSPRKTRSSNACGEDSLRCTNHCQEESRPDAKGETTGQKQNTGRWGLKENVTFLRGYKKYGKGKWKNIGEHIPTRTKVQVKTHGQQIMRKEKLGDHIYDLLDKYGYEFGENEELLLADEEAAERQSSVPRSPVVKSFHMIIDGKDSNAARILMSMKYVMWE